MVTTRFFFPDKSAPKNIFLWTLVIFWMIFGIKRGAFLDTINFLCLGFLVYDVVTSRKLAIYNSLLFILIIYAIYSNLRIAFCGVWDTWHIFQPWRALLVLLGITSVIKLMYKDGYNWEDIIAVLMYAIYLHGFIIVFTFFNLDARAKLSAFTGFVDKSDLRTPGLTNTYGITSQIMSIPLFAKLLVKKSYIPIWAELTGLLFCLISLLFTARIGLYGLPLIIFIIIFRMLLKGRLPVKFLLVSSAAILILCFFIYAEENEVFDLENSDSVVISRINTFFSGTLHHSLELYFSAKKGDPEIKSFQTIKSFVFHNNTIFQYVFGTGLFGRGDPLSHLYTDIAYAHMFSMLGLFGLSLLFIFYIFPFLKFPKVPPDLRFIFFIITIISFVGNYKESTLLTRSLFSIWCILVCTMKNEANKRIDTI